MWKRRQYGKTGRGMPFVENRKKINGWMDGSLGDWDELEAGEKRGEWNKGDDLRGCDEAQKIKG